MIRARLIRKRFQFPPEKEEILARAKKLEWTTLVVETLVVVLMYFTMGNSQAMKTAWAEDLLSLVPPLSFLIFHSVSRRKPDRRFPFGYHRALSIAFLVGACALAFFGLQLLFDTVSTLIRREHPSIGSFFIRGHQVWQGWIMIAVLVFSSIPPVVMGRLKQNVAKELHLKVLHADAEINKADWMTAAAGILGILGIAWGFWWADALAAGLIALDVCRDGFVNVKGAVADLMDGRPMHTGGNAAEQIPESIEKQVAGLPWVRDVAVRLREEGDLFCGEMFVVVKDETDVTKKMAEARELAMLSDWRIYEVVVSPVALIEREGE